MTSDNFLWGAALGVSRQLICWGRNVFSQAQSLSKIDSVQVVAAGHSHSCYILSARGEIDDVQGRQ